jgi:hypothetical protein
MEHAHQITETIRNFVVCTLHLCKYSKSVRSQMGWCRELCTFSQFAVVFDVACLHREDGGATHGGATHIENGSRHNSSLVSQVMLKVVGAMIPSQYAPYRVLVSPKQRFRYRMSDE